MNIYVPRTEMIDRFFKDLKVRNFLFVNTDKTTWSNTCLLSSPLHGELTLLNFENLSKNYFNKKIGDKSVNQLFITNNLLLLFCLFLYDCLVFLFGPLSRKNRPAHHIASSAFPTIDTTV